jgi:hypothetical protein
MENLLLALMEECSRIADYQERVALVRDRARHVRPVDLLDLVAEAIARLAHTQAHNGLLRALGSGDVRGDLRPKATSAATGNRPTRKRQTTR